MILIFCSVSCGPDFITKHGFHVYDSVGKTTPKEIEFVTDTVLDSLYNVFPTTYNKSKVIKILKNKSIKLLIFLSLYLVRATINKATHYLNYIYCLSSNLFFSIHHLLDSGILDTPNNPNKGNIPDVFCFIFWARNLDISSFTLILLIYFSRN